MSSYLARQCKLSYFAEWRIFEKYYIMPLTQTSSTKLFRASGKFYDENVKKNDVQKWRPCGFCQSLGRPIVLSIYDFFWSAQMKLSTIRDRTIFFVHSLDFFLSSALNNFFLADQKKWKIDQTIGQPKRLTKTTWTSLNSQKNLNKVLLTDLGIAQTFLE